MWADCDSGPEYASPEEIATTKGKGLINKT